MPKERTDSLPSSCAMRWIVTLLVGVWGTLFTGLSVGEVAADQVKQKFKDKIHVVQPKPVLQGGRFELQPRFGMSVNDAINRSAKLGVNANYHLNEGLFFGGIFEWYNFGGGIGGPTDEFETVRNQTGTAADAAVINWLGGLEIGYAPLVGKLALFDSAIFFYDVAVSAGGVWIDAESIAIPSAKGKPGGTLALTSRVFLNQWLAINLEVRDTIFMADLDGVSGTLTNVVTAGAGVSVYFPLTFEYTEKRVELSGDES